MADHTHLETIAADSDRAAPGTLERALVDGYQRDFPRCPRPYAEIARRLGSSEAAVLAALARMTSRGIIGRIGAVVRPNSVGRSTLAAMAVPEDRLEAVAALVSAYAEVNHNYEREHRLNLWFVVTAADEGRRQAVLNEIAERTGLDVLDLPLVEAFHVDLGFPIQWT